MKALYVPLLLLSAILAFSLWTGRYVAQRAEGWSQTLERSEAAAAQEDWPSSLEHLETAYADWDANQGFLHTIMSHEDIEQAECLFAGAFAACRERDEADFHILLSQLMSQLEHLSQTQEASLRNIL